MSTTNKASQMLNDYTNIRTMPAMLTVAYVMASLYQFGGIGAINLTWIGGTGGYALTAAHAVVVSLAVFGVAFAGSKTKSFESYDQWEQVAIAAGPAVIIGDQYVTEVHDFIISLGDPLGLQIAFLATVISWGVAVR